MGMPPRPSSWEDAKTPEEHLPAFSHSNADNQRLFHGIFASRSPRPQKPVTPANTSPAPTKADSPDAALC